MRLRTEVTSNMPSKLLSVAEVAEWLSVSTWTVYREWRSWGLHAAKCGRQLRFREADVEAFLRRAQRAAA